ncbi:MAG: sodium:solute symporter family protein [Candidatus Thermoplasmatota archaeon]|nr:sodium:solute symporter family protein [Candidatus Thermoplasmatota archaeon]
MMAIAMMAAYFLVLFSLGIYAHKKTKSNAEDYFLANRSFGPVILFFTLAATNFSAFTFLGFAGKAYTDGMGQYGIMAIGTSFMAVMFYVIGRKVWKAGKDKGYITPGELVGGRYNSRSLQLLFTGVMAAFTIPYLAIQAIGAGYILQMIFPGLSMEVGAVAVMAVICFYVLSGGMRASGWTDVFQGMVMVVAMVAAFAFIAHSLGGFGSATSAAYNVQPSLFSRPGPNGYFTTKIWLSFLILWIFCDPMFPQIFTRFYTAKSQHSLKISMSLYPLLISFLFLLPVLIGVWAHGAGIDVANPDNVLLLMVKNYTPSFVFSFVIVGALAALMSTADSQLLSLSTILTCDTMGNKVRYSRIVTLLLTAFAIVFITFGYNPKTGIMGTLVSTTFSGLVVLFPSVIATLYWKKATEWGCMASILGGEFIVFFHNSMPFPTFGFLPSMVALAFSFTLMFIFSMLTFKDRESVVQIA